MQGVADRYDDVSMKKLSDTPLPPRAVGMPVTGRLPDRLRTPKWLRRLVMGFIGSTVLVLGLVLFVLPTPLGWFVVPVGLVILGSEFVWARQLLKKIRAQHKALEATLGTAERYAEALEDTLFGPDDDEDEASSGGDRGVGDRRKSA